MTEKEYVLTLTDPLAAELAVAGGKGAALARLSAAGLPVPGGFVLTTAAYQQFVADNDLEPAVLAALESVDASQPGTLEAASQAIGELFSSKRMPEAVAAAAGVLYLVAGFLVLLMQRRAAIGALVCLAAVVAGRVVLVLTGAYPAAAFLPALSVAIGTGIVVLFAVYVAWRWHFIGGSPIG